MSKISDLIHEYVLLAEKEIQAGETHFYTTTAYQLWLAGPLLGTIVTAAAAIEAFFRISMRAFLEKNLTKVERASGTRQEILKALTEFDSLSIVRKLDNLYNVPLERECSNDLKEEFIYLFRFGMTAYTLTLSCAWEMAVTKQ